MPAYLDPATHEGWLFANIMSACGRYWWESTDKTEERFTIQCMITTFLYMGLTRGEYAAFKQSKDVERLREIGITFPKSI